MRKRQSSLIVEDLISILTVIILIGFAYFALIGCKSLDKRIEVESVDCEEESVAFLATNPPIYIKDPFRESKSINCEERKNENRSRFL